MSSKQDYIAVARIVARAYPVPATPAAREVANMTRSRIARDLACLFAADNPRFDRARFLAACDVREEA